MSTVRSLADIDLRGSIIFGKNLSSFPENPRGGQTHLIEGVLWIYTTIDTISTWYPLTNKKNSYVHVQAVSAFQWVVNHGLDTDDVLYGAYDENGSLMIASRTIIDINSFRLNFTSAVAGRCVVFADSERFASSIAAGTLTAASIDVADGVVTADQTGLRVSGAAVATLSGGVLNSDQVPTVPFAKLSGVPTTAVGLGLSDVYTKTQADALLTGKASSTGSSVTDFSVNDLTTSGDILPSISGVSNIGSPTQKFAAIYTAEMHIDANTLYVDGVPVLGSSANSIQISASVNQGLRLATTGTGQTVLDSQAATTIQTNGANANVMIGAAGLGSQVQVSSANEIRLTAPTVRTVGDMSVSANGTVSGNLTVGGNLTVSGTQIQVNSTIVTIKDNVVVYNYGEIGSGITNRYSGFQIDRGDLTDVRFVFDENDDKWKAGLIGSESTVAMTSDLTGFANTADVYSKIDADARYLTTGITIDGGVL